MILVKLLGSIKTFEWDSANISHIARHNVLQEEAEEIFFDQDSVLGEDFEHSTIEKRFLIIAKTKEGRLLYQIFTFRGNKIRVISSRDINKKEVKLYEKETRRS